MCKKLKGIHNRIDKCMVNLIDNLKGVLNDYWKTVACCCGHGKYPMTLVIKGAGESCIEIFNDAYIPRTRRIYKKDKQGFYYIPEVLEKIRGAK